MLLRLRGLLENHKFAFYARVFLHHHGIRAARHGSARQNTHAFARAHGAAECDSCATFADQSQPRARLCRIGRAHGETIANRTVKGRVVAVGDNIFGENTAQRSRRAAISIVSVGRFRRARRPLR